MLLNSPLTTLWLPDSKWNSRMSPSEAVDNSGSKALSLVAVILMVSATTQAASKRCTEVWVRIVIIRIVIYGNKLTGQCQVGMNLFVIIKNGGHVRPDGLLNAGKNVCSQTTINVNTRSVSEK